MLTHVQTLIFADATDAWSSSFMGLDPDHRFVLMILTIVFGAFTFISVVGILSALARSMHNRRAEAELKRDLLDRGMSVDEVVRVVEATAGRAGGCGSRRTSRGEIQ